MEKFDRIYERAVARKGEEQLLASLPRPRTALGLKRLAASTYLSEMSRAVFRSGFVWRIVATASSATFRRVPRPRSTTSPERHRCR